MNVKGKVVNIIVAIVALLILLWAIYFGARSNETQARQPAPTVTSPVSPAPAPSPAEPSKPSPYLPAERPAALQAQSNEPTSHSGPDLSGTWGLFVSVDDGEPEEWERFAFEQRGNTITGRNVTSNHDCAVTLDGMSVKIETDFEGRRKQSFTGTLQPSHTEIAGTCTYTYVNPDPDKEDYVDTQNGKLVRISEAQLAKEKVARDLRQKRNDEVAKLFAALKHFADRNGGKFPGDLAQLSSEDLDDLSLLANEPGRRITYTGGAALTKIEGGADAWRKFKEQGTSKESLIELEKNLREIWGGKLPFQTTVLRVEYDNPPLAFDIASSGDLRASDQGGTRLPGEEQNTDALRQAEFNNLKQLGLVCKMFGNENQDHLPGGWLMVYPEYLGDLHILQSPWAADGTDSYELLFPGETEKDLEALATQLFESGAVTYPHQENNTTSNPNGQPENLQSAIPIVISQDELPAEDNRPPARAVLFLDGHVEAVSLADWDTRITPFLRQ